MRQMSRIQVRSGKKAQMAVEYLTTYGWAIVALMAVMVVLYTTGIFDVQNYMPRQCSFMPAFECSSYKIYTSAGKYNIRFMNYNGLGFDIKITKVNITTENLANRGKTIHKADGTSCVTCVDEGCATTLGDCTFSIKKQEDPSHSVFDGNFLLKQGEGVDMLMTLGATESQPSIGTAKTIRVSLEYMNCETDSDYDGTAAKCDAGTAHIITGYIYTQVEPE
ncbi:MAG: hypothetical protein QXP42_00110 [Candidatus Micrarchaeia archaeon]